MNGLNENDYGGRWKDNAVPGFTTMDPLCEKYYSISPYAYCAGNPVKFIDPTGMLVDDYFNVNGDYLGKDEATTDNVKITSQESWDASKTVNSDGTETIDHATGSQTSVDNSDANLSTNAELSVYDYYNPTNLPLVDAPAGTFKPGETGMSFQNDQTKAVDIAVDTKGLKDVKISDHSNEIQNLFVHEKGHFDDFTQKGATNFNNSSARDRERIAIPIQMKDDTFLKMRKGVQDVIKQNAKDVGL